MNGRVTAADFWIAEEINLAIGCGADVGGISVKNELFSLDDAGGDSQPAGAGGAFDDSGGRAGDEADAAESREPADFGIAGHFRKGIEQQPADQAAERPAGDADEEPLAVFGDDSRGD